jgi:DNA mismatch repair ATPase MutS
MKKGESKQSYGIKVASMAGIPKEIIKNAYKKQKDFEDK